MGEREKWRDRVPSNISLSPFLPFSFSKIVARESLLSRRRSRRSWADYLARRRVLAASRSGAVRLLGESGHFATCSAGGGTGLRWKAWARPNLVAGRDQ